jgi:rfaE bifunctional protein kinase chain/domain
MQPSGWHSLPSFSPARSILVVGDLILDEYLWGEVRRISPEAPVPVVEIRSQTHVPGGAANVAANLVSLGSRVQLAGVIGQDREGDTLVGALRHRGIGTDALLVDGERPTTTKTRVMAQNQQVVRIDREHRAVLATALEDRLLERVVGQVRLADACVLSDYGKGVVSPRLARFVIRQAEKSGKPIIVDPKNADFSMYRDATLLKPNLHEAERFLKQEIHDEAGFLRAGHQLVDLLPETAVLITRGALGMSLFRKEQEPLHINADAQHVFDVTGAGDTVVGTLAVALAGGAPLETAVRLANCAAGIVVAKIGTATVTWEEVRKKAGASPAAE